MILDNTLDVSRRARATRAAAHAAVARLEQLERRRLLTAAHVYVNDDWQITTDTAPPGLSNGDTVAATSADGGVLVGSHTFGTDAFATVAQGIANVTTGGTVTVVGGTYAESNLTIGRPMTVEGSGPFSVITPAAADGHDDSAFNLFVQNGLVINSGNVTVKTLTIDGGVGRNFRQGVITDFRSNTVFNNVTVDGMIVKNVYRRGIELYSSDAPGAPKSTGNVVRNNTIEGVTLAEGILLFDGDGTINNNNVGDAPVGIATNTIHGPVNAPLINAFRNSVAGSDAGSVIGMNMAGMADGSVVGPDNYIDLSAGSDDPDTGLVVQFPNGLVHVTQNQIFGSAGDSGIFVFAASDPTKPVDISLNSLSNAATNQDFDGDSTGIFVTDDGSFFGVNSALPSYVTISQNTFSGYTRGIDLFRSSEVGSALIQADINANTSGSGRTQIRVLDADGAAGGVQAIAHVGNDTGALAGNQTGIEVDGGLLDISGHATYALGSSLKVENGGQLIVLGGAQLVGGATSNDGTLTDLGRAQLGGITGTGTVNVGAGGATLSADYVRQGTLSIVNGARATMNNNNSNSAVSVVKSLSIGPSGRLDLTNNDLIYDYTGPSPRNAVRQMLRTGYNLGAWGGDGINSSQAQVNHRAAIGMVESSDLANLSPFDGFTLDSTAMVLRYTSVADAELDGAVTLTDFTFLAAHFNQSNTYPLFGDFNYDGTTDLTDFTIMASVFGVPFQSPPPPATPAARSSPTPATLGVDPARVATPLFASIEIAEPDALEI